MNKTHEDSADYGLRIGLPYLQCLLAATKCGINRELADVRSASE